MALQVAAQSDVPTQLAWWGWLALGLAAGGALVMVGARWQVRRSLLRQTQAEKRARSAERLAELGSMTRGLAHEIKNPLSTISLNAQLLGERVEDAPTDRALSADERAALRKRVESLRREVERLRGILTDFLTYAGELRVEVSPQDVASIVRDLADFFAPQAQHAGVRLRVEAQPQLPKAMCDSPHLKQALLNLLLNAQQAMLSNGPEAKRELIVRAVLRQPEKAQSRQVPRDQQIVIEVIDTGPGIAPDVLSKIFDPYFTTKAGGSGLGLPTSRRIIEAMGGRLEVESEVGRGTLMRVVLAGA